MKPLKHVLIPVTALLFLFSCSTVDLYEKTVNIPGHAWKSSFKPSFTFTIKDTASLYDLYLVLRHTDKYSFNNIYINLSSKTPGQDSLQSSQYDLVLGTDAEGWKNASGMDDVYEHRIRLTDQSVHFRKPGDYTYVIEQIMREDPLQNVLNVGLRIEKKK